MPQHSFELYLLTFALARHFRKVDGHAHIHDGCTAPMIFMRSLDANKSVRHMEQLSSLTKYSRRDSKSRSSRLGLEDPTGTDIDLQLSISDIQLPQKRRQ